VRQREEDDVVARERVVRGGLENPVRERREVGLVLAERRPGAGGSGQRADPDLGVPEEEAEQLTTGVSAGARDGDGDAHVA
jgi:hypothetical protein